MDDATQIRSNTISAESSNELASKSLDVFWSAANEKIGAGDFFRVAISGGRTPLPFYEQIAEKLTGEKLDWAKVQLFWVDERCVSPESSDSNYKLAKDTFLSKVNIPDKNIHRIPGEISDYKKAAEEYQETIRDVFDISEGVIPEFDLVILGMGADGHIGSLFPDSNALFDTHDLACPVYLPHGRLNRVTLTLPVIKAARRICIIVSGAEKAEIVKRVLLDSPDDIQFPVHSLWPVLDKVQWLIDQEAGKYL